MIHFVLHGVITVTHATITPAAIMFVGDDPVYITARGLGGAGGTQGDVEFWTVDNNHLEEPKELIAIERN